MAKRPAIKELTGILGQRSLSEGVWNGRKGWLAVGAVVWGVRGVRWALSRDEKVLLREVLEPGETVIVREVPRKAPKAKDTRKAKAKGTRQAEDAGEPKAVRVKVRKPTRKERKAAARDAKRARRVEVEVTAPPKLSRKQRKAVKRAAAHEAAA